MRMFRKFRSQLRYALGVVAAMVTTVVAIVFLSSLTVQAQSSSGFDQSGPGPGPFGPGPGCTFFPAVASLAATGSTVDPSYFGPPSSSANPSLVGPYQLVNAGKIDFQKGTITLPPYKGSLKTGETIWYILTDTDDQANATALGLNFSSKLSYSGSGVRTGNFDSKGNIVFNQGKVDFSPQRQVQPGPSDRPFPPASAQPGSVGDAAYSPLVRIRNSGGHIYNAPTIAFNVSADQISFPNGNPDYSLVHDEVVAIDPAKQTVTLNLIDGFSFGRPILYISLETSDPTIAAIEGNTYSPGLKRVNTGKDDSFGSAIERLFAAVNGPSQDGCANPQRQGLSATLLDGYRPNNTFGAIPTLALDYSPLWDVQQYEWTQDAINKGYRSQLREEFEILTLVEDGILTGPNGGQFGTAGIIIDCPPVYRFV